MYDNNLFIGLLIFATVLAVVGLVLVFLQKKGIVKSFTTVTQSGPDYVSVGKAFIVPVFLGVLLLYRYSLLWAVLYGAILYRGLYIDPGVGEIKIQNCQKPKINRT